VRKSLAECRLGAPAVSEAINYRMSVCFSRMRPSKYLILSEAFAASTNMIVSIIISCQPDEARGVVGGLAL